VEVLAPGGPNWSGQVFLVGVLPELRRRCVLGGQGEEEKEGDQSRSQTEWVTAYRIHWQEGFKLPFSLLIIDTPGIDSTAGVAQDKMLESQLCRLFQAAGSPSAPPVSVCSLNAICLTIQATTTRLASAETYTLSMLSKIFGFSGGQMSHLLVFATFSDSSQPEVKSALERAEVCFGKLFKFNNSACYARNSRPTAAARGGNDEQEGEGSFGKLYWNMVQKNFDRLARHLSSLPAWDIRRTMQALGG